MATDNKDTAAEIAFDLVGEGSKLAEAINHFARKLGYVADLEASEHECCAARIAGSIRGDSEDPNDDPVVKLQTIAGWLRVELFKRTIEALRIERERDARLAATVVQS